MCGIAGKIVFEPRRFRAVQEIKKMGDVIAHRGPDGEGIYTDEVCGMVHRRLSIIDVSGGDQPIYNEDDSKLIIFNGEIYNYLTLRKDLIKKGHTFRTNSDTETILHLYEEYGEVCVTYLTGMFSFAIWDRKMQELFIARDRLGIKPLYYGLFNNSLTFGSEIKAILVDSDVEREIDLNALSEYLSFLYVPAPRTIFKNIYKLPAGHYIKCNRNGHKLTQYWNPTIEMRKKKLTSAEYIEIAHDLIKVSVEDRLMSEVPLGAFLSGGVDSSAVVAFMQNAMRSPVSTCTVGFKENSFDESNDARIVAEHLKTNHNKYTVVPDILQILEKTVWHLDEPFADASSIPTYYLCEMARKKVTVALAGDGGDEVFAGYSSYVRGLSLERFRNFISVGLRNRVSPCINKLPETLRGTTFLKSLFSSQQIGYYNRWSYFKEALKEELFLPAISRKIDDLDSFGVLRPYFDQCKQADCLSQWQFVDLKTYLVDDILMKVDKMSMAHSLEVRVPFLDHRIVEFALTIPSDYKMKNGMTKYILKSASKRYLPQHTLLKAKHGFLLPIGHWLRGSLRQYAEELLFGRQSACREYFNLNTVNKIWDIHQANNKHSIDLSLHIWTLIIFELWHRAFAR